MITYSQDKIHIFLSKKLDNLLKKFYFVFQKLAGELNVNLGKLGQ